MKRLGGKEPKTVFTGDGLKMSMGVGAVCVDLEWAQAHPTGLVHPGEPDAKVSSWPPRRFEVLAECCSIWMATASATSLAGVILSQIWCE